LFDGFDEIVSTNSTVSLTNATVGSNMPTVTLREARQRPQQQRASPSFVDDADVYIVPNASYSPTLGLTIGSINVDEPAPIIRHHHRQQQQQQEGPILIEDDDNITDSSSADIPTSEWDSYIDYVTCSESDDEEGSNNNQELNEHKSGGWRQCLAWVSAKAGGHRPKRRRVVDDMSPSSSSSEDNINEDWQTLGFSQKGFQSLGRDLNRPGSCMYGLLLMIYFAVEDNEAADIVLKVIRNTSVCPPELFGLFAVNGAKWVSELFHGVGEDWYRRRDLDFDYIATWWLQSSATKVTPGFPKDIEKKFIRVRRGRDVYGYEVLSDDNDGILPMGDMNSDDPDVLADARQSKRTWARSAGTGSSGDVFIDNVDIIDSDRSIRMRNRMSAAPGHVPPPDKLLSMRKSISSSSSNNPTKSRRSSNIATTTDKQQQHGSITRASSSAADSIPEEGPSASSPMLSQPCTMVIADRVPSCHNVILWTDVLVASGALYSYIMISFAKFWLEQGMIQASGEDANKKLNNEFINQHFVSKLTVPRGGIAGITSRTGKVFGRVKDLYQKLEDEQIRKLSLASRLSERSSIGGGEDDNDDVGIPITRDDTRTLTTARTNKGLGIVAGSTGYDIINTFTSKFAGLLQPLHNNSGQDEGEGSMRIYTIKELTDYSRLLDPSQLALMISVEPPPPAAAAGGGGGIDIHRISSAIKGEAAYKALCEETQTRFVEMQQGLSNRIQILEYEKKALMEQLERAAIERYQKRPPPSPPPSAAAAPNGESEGILRNGNGFVTTRRQPTTASNTLLYHGSEDVRKYKKKSGGGGGGGRRASYSGGGTIEYRGHSKGSAAAVGRQSLGSEDGALVLPSSRQQQRGGGEGHQQQQQAFTPPPSPSVINNRSIISNSSIITKYLGMSAATRLDMSTRTQGGELSPRGGVYHQQQQHHQGFNGVTTSIPPPPRIAPTPRTFHQSASSTTAQQQQQALFRIPVPLPLSASTMTQIPRPTPLTATTSTLRPPAATSNDVSRLLSSQSSLMQQSTSSPAAHMSSSSSPSLSSSPGWICDPDRYMSHEEVDYINQQLNTPFVIESECGPYQLAVAVSRNTWPVGGVERFARNIHNSWGVGHAPCDSGVVMALDIGNREMFISTGKAANDRLSTSSASVIIDRMRPFMREFKYAEGIFEGVKLIHEVIDTGEQLSTITFPLIFFFTVFFGIWGCVIFAFIKACLQNRRTTAVRRQLNRMENERAEALQGHFRQTSCPICLEDFDLHESSNKKNDSETEQAPLTGQECELLRCGHKFHKACLQEWQEQGIHRARDGLRCPVCRKDVNKDNDDSDDDTHGGDGSDGKRGAANSSSSSTSRGIGGMTYIGPYYPGYEYGPLWDFQMMRLRHRYPGIITDGFVNQYSWTSLGTGTSSSSCPLPSQDRSINPPPPSSSSGRGSGGGGFGGGGSNFGGGGASGGGAGGSW
ncbi:hypothetical protein FOL47_007388, partial [Perkinsus chesapeaki]